MANLRGTSSGQASSNTVWPIGLPAAAVANDWVLCAVGAGGNSAFDPAASGLATLVEALIGTGRVFIGAKKLTASDITAGTLTITTAASTYICWASAAYSSCDGMGPKGTETYRTISSGVTTAASTTLAALQKCLVVRVEKSTSNPGPVSASPTLSPIAFKYPNSAAWPSVWVAEYSAPSTTYTLTDPVASANGMAVQVPVIDSATPPTNTITVWNGTAEVPATIKVWNGTAEVPATI